MEQLKVKKKDTIIMNVVIYLFLSFFFLYIQHAYRYHLAPFSLVYLQKGIELFWYIAVSLVFTALLIWRHHKYSVFFYQVSILLIVFKVVEGLFMEFNKIIVVAMFFYITISYFLYQLLKHYLALASINPNYQASDLFDPLLTKIPCHILVNDTQLTGNLTNWDNEGCFVKLNETMKLPSKVEVKIFFKDREFSDYGEVVAATADFSGIGLKFNKSPKVLSVFNWAEFVEIVNELGFQPERLR